VIMKIMILWYVSGEDRDGREGMGVGGRTGCGRRLGRRGRLGD
jgi:hypothetical protein